MLQSDLLLSFALVATLIELTPGPNMAYLAILSIQSGRRAGLSAVAASRWACSAPGSLPRSAWRR